ncbi:unnamed protein product [Adineta ricciae]|uniref:Uncharacterized protein n=1 Tax=Adineta ricciae TaxID=249248 RepID=A0A814CC02_ADIRI|nr:unnamed protein product [Adineta ricciae]CAF1398581.1 unnamed protein product [Adineta ricciae]
MVTSNVQTTTLGETTQAPSSLLCNITTASLPSNNWTLFTTTYRGTHAGNTSLMFYFVASSYYNWYFDDASVKDSVGNEKLINGNFDNSTTLVGWTNGYIGVCSYNYGVTTSNYYSSNKSYYDSCILGIIWISQNFIGSVGELYNVSSDFT